MESTSENVIYLVQKRLRDAGPEGHRARVLAAERRRDAIHQHDWWMVQIEVDTPLDKLFRYYELLSRVEEMLEQEDGLNTLIVPTIPEDQAAA